MESFARASLSEAGTLSTQSGEIAITSLDKVSLLTHDKQATPYKGGLITITTHRLVWTDAARKSAISAPLQLIDAKNAITDKSTPFNSRLLIHLGAGVRLEFDSRSSKDRGNFSTALKGALARAEWTRQAVEATRQAAREEQLQRGEFVRRRVGATGVADRVQQRTGETGRAIAGGFESLERLRDQAEELVRIARRFQGAVGRERGEEENELLGMMAALGIESPVTKEGAGGHLGTYREQLARQMGEFLRGPILSVGGVMTLSDAYCLVTRNRASTELVSPADFRGACDFFGKIGLAVGVVRLESGVLALQVDGRDRSGAETLVKLAKERRSVSALEVVSVRHVPIQRATAMLVQAEGLGLLVRDVSDEGVRFFPNEFEGFKSVGAKA